MIIKSTRDAQRSIKAMKDSMQKLAAVQTDGRMQVTRLARSFHALEVQARPQYVIQEEP